MTSSEPRAIIVIGGGHNGLVAATLLARAGCTVTLLEAGDDLGGPARTEEFHPGFRASTAHIAALLHPELLRKLDLAAHGLALDPAPIPSTILSGGAPLVLGGAWGETVEGDIDEGERAAWSSLRAMLLRFAGVLRPFLTRAPPALAGMSTGETLALGQAALSLRRLGKEDMRDFLRMLLMNVHDVADDHLADDRLKGLLAFDATLGIRLGPRSPTSLLGLYYRLAGEVGGRHGALALPAGGMGSVIAAIRAAAVAAGVVIRTGAPVTRIAVVEGRVSGIVLADGQEIAADTVVSAINPVSTLIDLVGPRHLDIGIVRKARAVRMKGGVAKLHLALDRLPDFAGVPPSALGGRLVVAPSSDHVERAFNPSKYGACTAEPVMEITLPSVGDPSLAPSGAAVLSAIVPHVPYRLEEGWEAGKPRLLATVMAVLERHAPGIGALVRHAELLTPVDIETRYRMPGGHWHHGELQVDQMLVNRPFLGAERYATPIDGLWLASAGSHPGGWITGVPGMNAARAVLKGRR